ncbi:MAG: radical SAM protein, partial [Saprospiraceae bacterium]
MAEGDPIAGRGAQKQMNNRFFEYTSERIIELEDIPQEQVGSTQYIPIHPKTIMNKVSSPDLRHDYSLNPYQGCEHGCVYCYARNSHQYWGYNAGLEFEQKILVKHNSPALLRSLFESKNWKASPFMLSGNTDCYQPIERKLKLTRSILELCLEFRHPVGIVTKNYLVTRDIDILTELAKDDLVHVAMSITTLNESLRRKLEPRTTTGAQRIKAVAQLSAAGVPVH